MDTIAKLARHLAPAIRWLRTHIGLCLVILGFVGVSGLYALETPFFEMPGETWHYRRVQTHFGRDLAPGLAFLGDEPLAPQADLQPPLYYALGALLIAPLDTETDDAVFAPNPYVALATQEGVGNRNVIIAKEAPRADGPLARALLRLRYLSIVAAAASLPLLYLAFLQLTRGRVATSLAALVALAFLPGFVFVMSGAGNHALGFSLCSLAFYLSLRMAEAEHPAATLRWSAALAAGLAALTAWWGLAAVALVGYALATTAHREGLGRRAAMRRYGAPGAAMLALGLAPLLWLVMRQAGSEQPHAWAALLEMAPVAKAQLALRAHWGLFGWLNIAADPFYYTTIAILMALCVAGLALQALRARWLHGPGASWRAELNLSQPRYGVALVWTSLGLGTAASSILWPELVFVGAALLPLAPGLALLLVLGLQAWIRRRYGPAILALLVLAFAAVSVMAPFVYVAPAYAAPPRLDLEELPPDLRPLDVTLGSELFLLGYRMDDGAMEPGGILRLELYWLARTRMNRDYAAHVTVLGRDEALVASHSGYLGGGVRPTSLWAPGDVIVDRLALRVAEDATAPTAADVRLSVYAETGAEPMEGVDPHGNALDGNFRIAQARLAAPVRVGYVPEHPIEANLDNEISLVGYGLVPRLPQPGEPWRIILYWRSEGPLIRDYTVFIHLVDPTGEMVSQVDGSPLQGSYPTSFWAMGEQVRDVHHMDIPESLGPGEYRLRVGLYRLETGERLVLLDSDPPQDYVAIGPINIP
jgi:hypothetical protein